MIYADRAKKHYGREDLGSEIARLGGQIKRVDQHAYKVKSQSSENGMFRSTDDKRLRGR